MATVANTSWYRKGTAGVTINSTKVTGSGTNWLTAGINPGATLRIDGLPYACEVAEVVSDTEIQLAQPYYGNTASGVKYSIDRNFQSTTNARIAAELADTVRIYQDIRDGVYRTIEGKSAYALAVENGYTGTLAQWLESLKGAGDYAELLTKVEPLTYDNAGAHNAICRGKNLGLFTDEQSAAIRAGTFKDIYVGDFWNFTNVPYSYYWPTADTTAQEGKTYYADVVGTELEAQPEVGADISGAGYFEKLNATYTGTMRVADLDYYLLTGDSVYVLGTHHIVVVPDTNMYIAPMNATNTTEGGYFGSKMRTVYLRRAEAIFKACFGENHILNHREDLTTAVTNGRASAGAWCDSLVELMDERMVYGSLIFDSASTDGGNTIPNRQSVACKQLNLFRHRPNLISNRQWYWLRNVVSPEYFASVNAHGNCHLDGASYSGSGVRPAALIY